VVRAGVHQALDELREVIGVLRDDDIAAGMRPQPGLPDLAELVAETRDAGTPVDMVNRTTCADALPDALARTAYRIVQEGLTNARKHAPGQPVRLLLDGRPADHLLVALDNPMAPASPAETAGPTGPSLNGSGTGTGLIGLTERVRLTGGELDHGVSPDGQFRLRATLPWPANPGEPA
jgi:signal transduction histidine kinase